MEIWVRQRGEGALRPVSAEDFALLFGVHYRKHLSFCNRRVEREIRQQCLDAHKKGCVDTEQEWLGALFREQLDSGFVAKVAIAYCNDELGYGLFARQDFAVGDYLMEYTGDLQPKPWVVMRPKEYNFSYPSSQTFWHKYIINSEEAGNESRFINHCDDPNVEAVAVWKSGFFHIVMRCIKAVKQGTQLAFDYGPKFWRQRQPPKHLFVETD